MTDSDRERLDAYVKRIVDAAPPLTAEQRAKIAALLREPPRPDSDDGDRDQRP